ADAGHQNNALLTCHGIARSNGLEHWYFIRDIEIVRVVGEACPEHRVVCRDEWARGMYDDINAGDDPRQRRRVEQIDYDPLQPKLFGNRLEPLSRAPSQQRRVAAPYGFLHNQRSRCAHTIYEPSWS